MNKELGIKMKNIMILPFGMFFLLLAASGYASTNVTQCAVLSQNNTVYTLNTSFTNMTTITCIDITGFNDTFDCQGFTMTGSGNSSLDSYSIVINGSGTNTNDTIQNCNLTNWQYGIYLNNAPNNTIINNTADCNNFAYAGVYLTFSSNNTIINNTVNGISYTGIYLNSSANNTLTDNIANGNWYDIYVFLSSNNTLTNNTVSNSHIGIVYTGSDNNILTNNTVSNNTYGIFLEGSSNNILTNNTVINNDNGFILYIFSDNNTISGGSIYNSTSADYYFYYVPSANNNFTNTDFTSARKIYFNDSISWFNYANDTSGLLLQTNNINDNTLTRTLNSWSATNINWNESDSSTDTANYTLYGLTANTFYVVYNNSVNRYNINSSSCGCINFAIDLTTSSQIIQVTTDTTPPTYTNNQSQLITTYTPIGYSNFSVTWNDNSGSVNAYLENNFSGSLINTSMSGSYPGYTYNTLSLAAGKYQYRFVANDSSGNTNATPILYFTISKGTLNLSLSVPNVNYPSNTVATASETNTGDADVNYTLYRNNTGLVNFSTNNGTSPAGETILLGVGAYLYVLNTSGGANWTANTTGINATAIVSQGTLSGSITGSNVNNPTPVSVTPSINNLGSGDTGVNYTFWRNGALISSALGSSPGADASILSPNTYTYILNSSGGANWTANSSIYTLTITVGQAPSSGTVGTSSIGGITSTGMISYINLAVGKANITANYITTSGKLIANIAKYQDVAIRGMNVTVVNNVVNIRIMISKLPSLPSNVPYDINGKVYNYINVGEQNFTDADIKSVNISFAVNKSWLTNNNIDASNITMYRWANNRWNDLSAVKVSDNGNEVFFTVSSPGLSVLIIGTKGGAPVITPTQPTTCTESWSCTDWSTCSNNQQTRTCTDANSCGTTTSKPSESQSCTVSKGETTVPSATPVPTSILTTVIVIVIVIIACVFIFLERAKISSYIESMTKKSNNHKSASYLETLARKAKPIEEEERLNVNVE